MTGLPLAAAAVVGAALLGGRRGSRVVPAKYLVRLDAAGVKTLGRLVAKRGHGYLYRGVSQERFRKGTRSSQEHWTDDPDYAASFFEEEDDILLRVPVRALVGALVGPGESYLREALDASAWRQSLREYSEVVLAELPARARAAVEASTVGSETWTRVGSRATERLGPLLTDKPEDRRNFYPFGVVQIEDDFLCAYLGTEHAFRSILEPLGRLEAAARKRALRGVRVTSIGGENLFHTRRFRERGYFREVTGGPLRYISYVKRVEGSRARWVLGPGAVREAVVLFREYHQPNTGASGRLGGEIAWMDARKVRGVEYARGDSYRWALDRFRRGLPVPPVVVNEDGWLVDGNHRMNAALAAGVTKVPAVVVYSRGSRDWHWDGTFKVEHPKGLREGETARLFDQDGRLVKSWTATKRNGFRDTWKLLPRVLAVAEPGFFLEMGGKVYRVHDPNRAWDDEFLIRTDRVEVRPTIAGPRLEIDWKPTSEWHRPRTPRRIWAEDGWEKTRR